MAVRVLTSQELAAIAAELIQQVRSEPSKHLTEAEFADREGVTLEAAKKWRRNGDGPDYLLISESKTKQTIRYRLVDVEDWEQSRLRSAREPQPAYAQPPLQTGAGTRPAEHRPGLPQP